MTLHGFPRGLVTRFVPRRALASGSYGHVFEATQVALDRNVAIKVLAGDSPRDSDLVKRFDSEAWVTAALSHPHIVVVLEHGVVDGARWVERPSTVLTAAIGALSDWAAEKPTGSQLFDRALETFEKLHFLDGRRPLSSEAVGTWYRLLGLAHDRPHALRASDATIRLALQARVRR